MMHPFRLLWRSIRVALIGALVLCAVAVNVAWALNIDSTSKYAWGENIGWVNFGTTEGDVDVGSTTIDGYAWGENVGWISLTCSNTGTCGTVDYGLGFTSRTSGDDTVTGYAWGENVGWISFSCTNTSSCATVNYGVTVNGTTGDFAGYAWGENVGWISFNCSNTSSCATVSYKVKTSSLGAATATPSPTLGGGGGIIFNPPAETVVPSPGATPLGTTTPSTTPSGSPVPIVSASPAPPLPSVVPPAAPPGGHVPPSAPPSGGAPVPPAVQFGRVISDAVDALSRRVFGDIDIPVGAVCGGAVGLAACGATAASTAAVVAAAVAAIAQKEVTAGMFSLLQVVGIKRRAKVWGSVYDSATKHPVPFAKLELLDEHGRVLETRFSDRDGRYGFLTTPASLHQEALRVRLRVEKSGYRFPAAHSVSGTDYIVYDNLYTGGEVVLQGAALLRFNVPLDPVSPQRVRMSGFGRGLLGTLGDRLLSFAFFVGLITVPLNWWFVPSTKNLIILILFFGVNAARMIVLYRPYGTTIDALTGKRMSFALVTLNNAVGERVGFAVSDEYGRFILPVERDAEYEMIAYTPANISPQRTIRRTVRGKSRISKRGWVTQDIRI
ncbi:MAG: hypothetical protein IT405_00085 [Candidatus Yanofskybacteria bacterium]|nr:hypothetical protein [Candidatus Yanofskybacteria bacterium]